MGEQTRTQQEKDVFKGAEDELYVKQMIANALIGLALLSTLIKYDVLRGNLAGPLKDALQLSDKSLPWAIYFLLVCLDDFSKGDYDMIDDEGFHNQYVMSMLVSIAVFPQYGNVRSECALVYGIINAFIAILQRTAPEDHVGAYTLSTLANEKEGAVKTFLINFHVWLLFVSNWCTRLPYLDAAFPQVRDYLSQGIGQAGDAIGLHGY